MTGTVSKIVFDRSLKMYGKPCRYGVAYGNHKSKVFRLCLSVICGYRGIATARPQIAALRSCSSAPPPLASPKFFQPKVLKHPTRRAMSIAEGDQLANMPLTISLSKRFLAIQ